MTDGERDDRLGELAAEVAALKRRVRELEGGAVHRLAAELLTEAADDHAKAAAFALDRAAATDDHAGGAVDEGYARAMRAAAAQLRRAAAVLAG